MKEKMRNYGFWVSLTSAVLLALQGILLPFGIELTQVLQEQILYAVNGILGVCVILGIVSNPKEGKWFIDKT